jgi:hypothetical protein
MMVQDKVSLFIGAMINTWNDSSCYILHDKFQSVYDLITQKFVAHVEYPFEIVGFIKHRHDATYSYPGLLLADG